MTLGAPMTTMVGMGVRVEERGREEEHGRLDGETLLLLKLIL